VRGILTPICRYFRGYISFFYPQKHHDVTNDGFSPVGTIWMDGKGFEPWEFFVKNHNKNRVTASPLLFLLVPNI
jgi:hypothetical protein